MPRCWLEESPAAAQRSSLDPLDLREKLLYLTSARDYWREFVSSSPWRPMASYPTAIQNGDARRATRAFLIEITTLWGSHHERFASTPLPQTASARSVITARSGGASPVGFTNLLLPGEDEVPWKSS